MLNLSNDAKHACGQTIAMDDQNRKRISKLWEILLDSKSTCEVIVSRRSTTNDRD